MKKNKIEKNYFGLNEAQAHAAKLRRQLKAQHPTTDFIVTVARAFEYKSEWLRKQLGPQQLTITSS